MFGFDDLILGAIGAGGSLLSGMGAKKSAAAQEARQREYDAEAHRENVRVSRDMFKSVPKQILADSQAAGFNPVTWLNAGALSYYSSGYQMRLQSASQAVNIPSSLSAIGGGLSAFGDALGTSYRASQKYDLGLAALRQQVGPSAMPHVSGREIGNSGLGDAVMGLSATPYGVPQGVTYGGALSGASRSARGKTGERANLPDWSYDPRLPQAQEVENEYGWLGDFAYTVPKFAADAYVTTTGRKSAYDDLKAGIGSIKEGAKNLWGDKWIWERGGGIRGPLAPFFHNPGNVPEVGLGM